MDLSPGCVVAGRYRVDHKVGAGGMGEVWAGEHLAIGVKVAIKTLLGRASAHHEVVARFRREAFLLGRIRSDHVSRVLDFLEDETYGLVIVMEFVEGQSLADVLDEGRLTPEETVELALDLTTALCDLHRANIVHRDLKPGNLIMQPLPDGRRRAVVVDFGISRLLSGGDRTDEDTITGITKANMALGTVEYMSPEQILNSRDVTPVSDIYAVGAILYRALAGGHAYGQKEEDALARAKLVDDAPPLKLGRNDRIANGIVGVVMKAIQRRPANRFASATEMMANLLPLRDLVKIMELELDATTTADGSDARALQFAMGDPDTETSPPSSSDGAMRAQAGSAPELRESMSSLPELESSSSGELAHATSLPTPGPTRTVRTGVPKGVFASAVAAAFAVGAAAAVAFMPARRAPEPVSPDAADLAGAQAGLPAEEATAGAVEPPPPRSAPLGGEEVANDESATIDLDAEMPASAAPPPKPLAIAAPRPAPPPATPVSGGGSGKASKGSGTPGGSTSGGSTSGGSPSGGSTSGGSPSGGSTSGGSAGAGTSGSGTSGGSASGGSTSGGSGTSGGKGTGAGATSTSSPVGSGPSPTGTEPRPAPTHTPPPPPPPPASDDPFL